MLKRKSSWIAYLVVLFVTLRPASAADLFHAVRADDLATVRSAAGSGAAREARGAGGATPLIYAAAFGSPESVRALVEAGADVNARTDLGANALIWAAGDPAKTEILVRAGADVNAASNMGRTPLMVAAGRDGSAETVRMLLEKGADPRAADQNGSTPLLAAALAADTETVRLLIELGADVNQADKAGNTPLQLAAANGGRKMVRMLLANGARVNDANTFGGAVRHGDIALQGLTPLMLAADEAPAGVLRMLLDAGAEVNARDSRGMTALMLASASARQDEKILKLLLRRGADPKAVSASGETALDWAAKFGDPGTTTLLAKAGAERKAPLQPAPPAQTAVRDAHDAVSRAVHALQTSEAEFFRQSACVSCHHQNMTQIATAAARQAGLPIDEKAAAQSVEATVALWSGFAPALLERMDPPGSPDTPTFSLFALAMQQTPPSFVTDALFSNVAAQQRQDGSWRLMGFPRAPLEDSHFMRTAMAVRALSAYAPAGRKGEMHERQARARTWLAENKPNTTDDAVWRLAGLHWSSAPKPLVREAARELLALQRPDGGWAGAKTMAPDAYVTGSALWALSSTRSTFPAEEPYQRGARFLLSTQQPDGTWFVRSRSVKFQPYFDSGFPYGDDQWISFSATAWAAAALAPAAHAPTMTD